MSLTENFLLTIAGVTLFFAACKKEEEKKSETPLDIASSYDSSNYLLNSEKYGALRGNFDLLVVECKKARVNGVVVNESSLNNFFEAGTTSIKSVTIPSYASQLQGPNGWFKQLALASGNAYHVDSSSINGGTFGGYLFDENGFEPEQMIEKGLFGAALSHEAIKILNNNPGLNEVDYALGLIGATPHFKSSNNAKHGSAADKYLAVYLARRDKNDGNGFYTKLKSDFLKLQAAIKGGEKYTKEKNEAIQSIKLTMEQANFATIINYCHTSIANLTLTTLTEAQKAATLHALGECVGFAIGWKELPGKKITDAQIDELLTLLNNNAKPSTFITNRVSEITKLQQTISKIKEIYGFTDVQVEDFKKNWVSEQNR
jgi:hypothetical protein